MSKKILVPLDGSNFAKTALKYARQLCEPGDEITLLRVIHPVVETALIQKSQAHVLGIEDLRYGLPSTQVPLGNAEFNEAEQYVSTISSQLRNEGCVVHQLVCEGPVVEEIVEAGKKADMIVMSTHGRSGIARVLLGSVASAVLHAATVPVMLVKPEPMDVLFGNV